MAFKPLREYQPKDPAELVDFLEASAFPKDLAEFVLKLEPGEKITNNFLYFGGQNIKDTRKMQRFIEALREVGVDIGRGESPYGFKMPLPNPKAPDYQPGTRQLIIFRRQ